MATQLWTSPDGTELAYYSNGALEAFDRHEPIPDKNEWGVDTLQRTLYVPAPVLTRFVAELRQGDVYSYNGTQYFLQTWQPSHAKPDMEFSLNYKGLSNGLPDPLPSNSIVQLVSSLSATGLSVTYQGKTITEASSEVEYLAPQTVWRYISQSMPDKPKSTIVFGPAIKKLNERTQLTFSDGTTAALRGAAPAAVATALFRQPVAFIFGPNSDPIVGTPYWECSDVVQMKYPGS